MSTGSSYKLKNYHELKMSGEFRAPFVEELVEAATALTLGKMKPVELPFVPVDEVRLYDVAHLDTGNRRRINKRGDTIRVYESRMREITSAPLKALRFGLANIVLDGIGNPSGAVHVCMRGTILANLSENDMHQGFSLGYIKAVQEAFVSQKYVPQILGTLVIGKSFGFGEPTFHLPPNENYDNLVALDSFYDDRLSVQS